VEPGDWRPTGLSDLQVTRIADGKTFESHRIRTGEGSAISIWVAGLPETTSASELAIRLNGTDLPATWLAPATEARQINALLPAGLEPGEASVTVVFNNVETKPATIELFR
jgi:uncharacterized protein (TIGR03437 family)